MKERSFQLDLLRTVAILLVVFFHFYINFSAIPLWNDVVYNGGLLGVNFFFVLSGMLISYPFVKESLASGKLYSIKNYSVNRLLRIIPLFWFITIINFLLKDNIRLYQMQPNGLLYSDLIKYLFFFSSKLDILNPVIWTLRIEMLFYIIFPFLFYISLRWHSIFIKHAHFYTFLLMTCFLAYRCIVIYNNKTLDNSNVINNLEGFFLGINLSFIVLTNNTNRFKIFFQILTPIIGLLILVKLNQTIFQNSIWYYPFFKTGTNLCIFFLFIGLLRNQPKRLSKQLVQVISFISMISYSLYLIHFNVYYSIVLPILRKIYHSQYVNIHVWGALSLLITFLFSFITYRVVEQPFLALKKRVLVTSESR